MSRWPVAAVALALAGQVLADPPPQPYDLGVDVPSRLGGTDYTTNQVPRRSTASTYSLVLDLPPDFEVSAVERRALDGTWLLTPMYPWTIGDFTILPNDVMAWNGTFLGWALRGADQGVPADARIDAISDTLFGGLELSFDAPVHLGTTDYDRSDLVAWDGLEFTLVWSGTAAGVPAYANLVGASYDVARNRVLAFDVPVNLAGIEYGPGDLVRFTSPGAFSLASGDSGWPKDSEVRDFTGTPAEGKVGGLTLAKAAGSQIKLNWNAACTHSSSTDYAVYEGTLGGWYSHTGVTCSTGILTTTFAPAAGNRYFLVVPRNGATEGSYGLRTGNLEIPPASDACLPQAIAPCP